MKFFSRDTRNRFKNIVVSKHFRSSFFTLLILVTIVFIVTMVIMVNKSVSAYKGNLLDETNNIARLVQEHLNSAEDKAYFIGNLKSVNQVFGDPHVDMETISGMVEDISAYSNKSYKESISIFFDKIHRVYVSDVGLYSYEDFYEDEYIDIVENLKIREGWVYNNHYKRYYQEEYETLTYFHSVFIDYINHKGYITINIPITEIQKLIVDNSKTLPENFIVTHRGTLLYSSNSDNSENNISVDRLYKDYDNAGLVHIQSTNETPTSCSIFVKSDVIFANLRTMLKNGFLLFVSSLIAIFACSFLYSYIMLRSVDNIMLRLGGTPYTDYRITKEHNENEFSLLGIAVEGLNVQLQNLQSAMLKNRILVQEHLIYELLCNQGHLSNNRGEYEEFGITFPFEYFAVLIISLPDINRVYNYKMKEQLKFLVKENATSVLSGIGKAYGTNGENETILFLINSEFGDDELENKIYEACQFLSQHLYDTLTFSILFSACLCTPGDPKPYLAYTVAKRNIVYTYTDNEEFIFFSKQSDESISIADRRLIFDIVRAILDKNAHALKKVLCSYSEEYLKNGDDQRAKLLCSYCLCSVHIKLLETDIVLNGSQMAASLGKIEEASSIKECEDIMRTYFYSLINTDDKVSDQSFLYVFKAKEYIESNYRYIETVKEVAEHIAINSIYLNKLFKMSTGKTVSEYLNSYRIDISKEMLIEGQMTIQQISEEIGYNDVRSYIRFFKKFMGITPGKYRKGNGK